MNVFRSLKFLVALAVLVALPAFPQNVRRLPIPSSSAEIPARTVFTIAFQEMTHHPEILHRANLSRKDEGMAAAVVASFTKNIEALGDTSDRRFTTVQFILRRDAFLATALAEIRKALSTSGAIRFAEYVRQYGVTLRLQPNLAPTEN